jgi:enoyl-CoA hydratase
MSNVVLLDVSDRVALVTLNRPEARNALSGEVLRELRRCVSDADGNDDVDVIILTGADPAFCAGVDLKELGSGRGALGGSGTSRRPDRPNRPDGPDRGPLPACTKPVIGAINGAAITGGFEIALNCDFLIASDRARFADTHARVGIQPGWGLTVLLPQAVGLRRAREMSATGNFIDAPTALSWGLVNHVVAHEELLSTARRLAADIVSNDQAALRQIYATYDEGSRVTVGDAWAVENRVAAAWQGRGIDPAEIERRRTEIMERGRTQV